MNKPKPKPDRMIAPAVAADMIGCVSFDRFRSLVDAGAVVTVGGSVSLDSVRAYIERRDRDACTGDGR